MSRPWATVALNLTLTAIGLGVVSWALYRWLKRTEDPPLMIFKAVLSLVLTAGLLGLAVSMRGEGGLLLPGICVGYGVIMTFIWARHIGAIVASPFTSMFDGGNEEIEPQPMYSVALNKIKR